MYNNPDMSGNLRRSVNMVFLAAALAAALISCSFTQKITKVTGAVELGRTKAQVLKSIGKPTSPQRFDFYYSNGKSEIVICFGDKTGRVEAVIVMGKNPKYSVKGITVGSSMAEVKQVFGNPERVFDYTKTGVECWYYPSKNVYFAIDKGKVSSFSVNEWKY
jgi:outer membrane protein assembly factor BamE (lipoprotein component of BamABCDE complex)